MLSAFHYEGDSERFFHIEEAAGVAFGQFLTTSLYERSCIAEQKWHADDRFIISLEGEVFTEKTNPSDRRPATDAFLCELKQEREKAPLGHDGNYRAAIWDAKAKTLRILTDPLRKRPFYYACIEDLGLFVYASELKALMKHPRLARVINPEALTAFLSFGHVPAPLAIFENVFKLLPGETITFSADNKLRKRRYWRIPDFVEDEKDIECLAHEVKSAFLQMIEKNIAHDKRAGIYFSAGFDSAMIAASFKILGYESPNAFTVGIHSDRKQGLLMEDWVWSKRVAGKMGLRLHKIELTHEHNPLRDLGKLLRQFDEPLFTPHIESQYVLAERAKNTGVTQCFTGGASGPLFGRPSRRKREKLLAKLGKALNVESFIFENFARFAKPKVQGLLTTTDLPAPQKVGTRIIRECLSGIQAGDIMDKLYTAFTYMLVAGRNTDFQSHFTALTGVRIHLSFYDKALLNLANKIPGRFKGLESDEMDKAVLHKAFDHLIPEEVLRRRKIGYPGYFWHKEIETLRKRFLSKEAVQRAGLLNAGTIGKLHRKLEIGTDRAANSLMLGLVFLQAWHEVHVQGNENIRLN